MKQECTSLADGFRFSVARKAITKLFQISINPLTHFLYGSKVILNSFKKLNIMISYQEWQRDWPDDAQQPFRLELVLNPAKQVCFER